MLLSPHSTGGRGSRPEWSAPPPAAVWGLRSHGHEGPLTARSLTQPPAPSARQETMMDHALRTISYIADIGNIVVLMARRRMPRSASQDCIETTPGAQEGKKQYKMVCHVFESEDVSRLAGERRGPPPTAQTPQGSGALGASVGVASGVEVFCHSELAEGGTMVLCHFVMSVCRARFLGWTAFGCAGRAMGRDP